MTTHVKIEGRLNYLNKIVGIFLTTLLALVFTVSLSYYVLTQPNQTPNTPSPTPAPTQTPTPAQTPTSTQLASIPTLAVPEFIVELVANPYDVSTTYSINPYTGETITN